MLIHTPEIRVNMYARHKTNCVLLVRKRFHAFGDFAMRINIRNFRGFR